MFARITKYKMKAGSRDEAQALLEKLKDQIMALPGLINFTNMMNEDGTGYVVSLVTDQATSDANADKVQMIWGQFADFLEAVPVPEGYDVIAKWDN